MHSARGGALAAPGVPPLARTITSTSPEAQDEGPMDVALDPPLD
jgi:hypothetical protein